MESLRINYRDWLKLLSDLIVIHRSYLAEWSRLPFFHHLSDSLERTMSSAFVWVDLMEENAQFRQSYSALSIFILENYSIDMIIYKPKYSSMNNPFLYSKLSSYSSHKQSYPERSFAHSRILTELEISKPISLINDDSCASILSLEASVSPRKNPFYDNHRASRAVNHSQKENPFLYATPFRYQEKSRENGEAKGLTNWEKKKYLNKYFTQHSDNEQDYSGFRVINEEREQPQKKVEIQKTVKADNLENSKGPKRMFSFRSTNGFQHAKQPNQMKAPDYSFSQDREELPVQSSLLNSKEIKSVKRQYKSPQIDQSELRTPSNVEQIHKVKDQNRESLIRNLESVVEVKVPRNMSSSRVFEYKSREETNPYNINQELQRQKQERANNQLSQVQKQPVNGYEQRQQSYPPPQTSEILRSYKAAKPKQYPQVIRYSSNLYQRVKLI